MLTNVPEIPLCGALGESVFFDWQYTYTQPYDDIVWEKYIDGNETVDFVIGKLQPIGLNMKSKSNKFEKYFCIPGISMRKGESNP